MQLVFPRCLTGWQAGILTEGLHSKSRIREVSGGDIRKQLRAGKVVVVAGFQGINEVGDLTTFGRGGSDLSAIALAGALRAKKLPNFYRCGRRFHRGSQNCSGCQKD